MELTKKALQEVKFRTKGRWYSAQQVDEFIDGVIVAIDQRDRELDDMSRELSSVRGQLSKEQEKLSELKAELETVSARHSELESLEQERSQLLSDIKALRQFRDAFREAVEQDAKGVMEQLGSLNSKSLL